MSTLEAILHGINGFFPRIDTTALVAVLTANLLRDALLSGEHIYPLIALTGVAAASVVPLAIYSNIYYCISVGYGASIATMSLALMWAFDVSFPPSVSSPASSAVLAIVSFLYGVRLLAYIILRLITVQSMSNQARRQTDKMTQPKSIILATVLSALYACMVAPVLYALRGEKQKTPDQKAVVGSFLLWTGVLLASAGLVLETVADQHKYHSKRRYALAYGHEQFVGPTQGTYSLCRHPNYLGELVFWIGLYMGGVMDFKSSSTAWIASTAGLFCIVSIMLGSTKRLDSKQKVHYGGQPKFEQGRARVRAPLIPGVHDNL
jgi:steroid 5-alpha reductase family enzyme